jgi:hypothetical protein
MDELPSYKDIPYRSLYTFNCPEGVWRARLDAKAWVKQQNLILYFSEMVGGKKYCISVFKPSSYTPDKGGVGFRRAGQPGELFELHTSPTRTGRTKLLSSKILASERQPVATT